MTRIVSTIDAPVSVDFEGGYSDDNGALAENVARLLELGIIGINFEDRVVQGAGLYPIDRHARRIAAIREAAGVKGVDLYAYGGDHLCGDLMHDGDNSVAAIANFHEGFAGQTFSSLIYDHRGDMNGVAAQGATLEVQPLV